MFGSKKLPDTARAPGRSMRILRSETQAMTSDAQVGEGAARAMEAGAQAGARAVPPENVAAATVRTEPVAGLREPVADR